MGFGRLLAGMAVSCLVSLGAATGAAALTFDEYDRLVSHQQENFISTVLHFYYYRYKSSPETLHKANCMVDLDRTAERDGNPYLLSLIMRDLEIARANTATRSATVEGVIEGIISRECRTP